MSKYTVAQREKFFEQVKKYAQASKLDEAGLKLQEGIKKMASTTAGREELASLVTENLEAEMKAYDLRPLLFETKQRELLETVEYKRKGKFRAFRITRGGYVPKSQNFQDVVKASPEEFAVRPSCHLHQIRTGRISSVDELRTGAAEALLTEYNRYLFESLNTAVNATDNPKNVFTVSKEVSKEVLDAAIASAAKHGHVSIVGTYQSLLPITNFTGYTDTQKDEIMRTGKIGVYRGANLVELTEYDDADGLPVVKDDTIFLVVRKAGYIDDFGEMGNEEITDKEHSEFSILIRKEWGFTILYPEYLFMIKITA
ncbi:hypothetical protein pW4_32 [Bacillus phage pW4]|uniref:Major capsid protein n=1 Tax=Bacillus phage pW4 TaxID=2500560 RepID=A0A3Q9R7L5_9CAUD|nr:hypothetical protein PP656_gp101 [Bacillus phage pW4]AZU99052.1 hypothetical protein pW4_32 [Bacillus phage pW4]